VPELVLINQNISYPRDDLICK